MEHAHPPTRRPAPRQLRRRSSHDSTDAPAAPPEPTADSASVSVARPRQSEHASHADSGTEAASLSPWTGVGSPTSSDFEAISDSELHRDTTVPPSRAQVPSLPSNLARSLSQRRTRPDSHDSASDTLGSASGPGGGGVLGAAAYTDDEHHRRGIEGDDEDSSAFEGVDRDRDEGRGRARTRRVRDPELKRSMLEDALRSSLATLLSLAPAQAGMSQTPSMSHASLASLFQPTASSSAHAPGPSMSSIGFGARAPLAKRTSPFATALIDPLNEEDDDIDGSRAGSSTLAEDVFASSSSDEDESSTQLAPAAAGSAPRSRAIPILARSSRSRTRSYSDSQSDPYAAAGFSPLVPSRPLGAPAPSGAGQPSSNSPPYYSRSRRGAAPTRRRGRGRGGSASPGPASVEERRRARAAAAGAGLGTGFAGQGASEGEGEGVQRDEAFQELVDAARFFSDLSPRASLRAPYSSLPSSYETARPGMLAPVPASEGMMSTPPSFDSDEEDLALASESLPTLEGLSSGAEGERSPLPGAMPEEKRAEAGGEKGEGKAQGWFSWLRGLGATVEIKVWHLVGICGLLIGVGMGASSLVRTLAPASWLATRLDFAHRASPFLAPTSQPPPSRERLPTPTSPQSEGMSSLFL